MLTQHYSAQQRRALNQIWNAAGAYGFDPLFLALKQDGKPRSVHELHCGLCPQVVWGGDAPGPVRGPGLRTGARAMLDDLAWLALESAVFQLESPQRPALAELRQDHAGTSSARSTSSPARSGWPKTSWSTPSSRPGGGRCWAAARPVMTPYEAGLSKALDCGGITDGAALADAVRQAFAKAGLFNGSAQIHAPSSSTLTANGPRPDQIHAH